MSTEETYLDNEEHPGDRLIYEQSWRGRLDRVVWRVNRWRKERVARWGCGLGLLLGLCAGCSGLALAFLGG